MHIAAFAYRAFTLGSHGSNETQRTSCRAFFCRGASLLRGPFLILRLAVSLSAIRKADVNSL